MSNIVVLAKKEKSDDEYPVNLQKFLSEMFSSISDHFRKGDSVDRIINELNHYEIDQCVMSHTHIAFKTSEGEVCRIGFAIKAESENKHERKLSKSDNKSDGKEGRSSSSGFLPRHFKSSINVIGRSSRGLNIIKEIQRQGMYRSRSCNSSIHVPEDLIENCQAVLQDKSRQVIIKELQRSNLDVNMAVNNLLSRDDESDHGSGSRLDLDDETDEILSLLTSRRPVIEPEGANDELFSSASGFSANEPITMDFTDRRKRKRLDCKVSINHQSYRSKQGSYKNVLKNLFFELEEEGNSSKANEKESPKEKVKLYGELEWLHDPSGPEGQRVKFASIAAMHSELVCLGKNGLLYQWKWSSPLPFVGKASSKSKTIIYHPRAKKLGLVNEFIVDLSACLTRATVMTRNKKFATWFDESISENLNLSRFEHGTRSFKVLENESIGHLYTSPLASLVQTTCGKIYWWGFYPADMRQKMIDNENNCIKQASDSTKANSTFNPMKNILSGHGTIIPGVFVCMKNAPILHAGAIGFKLDNGIPKIGVLLEDAWKLSDVCRFRVRSSEEFSTSQQGENFNECYSSTAKSLSSQDHSLVCPFVQQQNADQLGSMSCYSNPSSSAPSPAGTLCNYDPTNEKNMSEMPPPPSPASSTCSEHSGSVRSSPGPFKKRKISTSAVNHSDWSDIFGPSSSAAPKSKDTSSISRHNSDQSSSLASRTLRGRSIDRDPPTSHQLSSRKSFSSVNAQSKLSDASNSKSSPLKNTSTENLPSSKKPLSEEEDWCLKDVVFVEDGRTQPVGIVLKVDGNIAAVKFLKEQERLCLSANCQYSPICSLLNGIFSGSTNILNSQQTTYNPPPCGPSSPAVLSNANSSSAGNQFSQIYISNPSMLPNNVGNSFRSSNVIDSMTWLNDCRLLSKDQLNVVHNPVSPRVPDFVLDEPVKLFSFSSSPKPQSGEGQSLKKCSILSVKPDYDKIHCVLLRKRVVQEDIFNQKIEYISLTYSGQLLSHYRLPIAGKGFNKTDFPIASLSSPSEAPLMLTFADGQIFPFLPPHDTRSTRNLWAMPKWPNTTSIKCHSLLWLPQSIVQSKSSVNFSVNSASSSKSHKSASQEDSSKGSKVQASQRTLLGVFIFKRASLFDHIFKGDYEKLKKLLNSKELSNDQLEEMLMERTNGQRNIIHLAITMCEMKSNKECEWAQKLTHVLRPPNIDTKMLSRPPPSAGESHETGSSQNRNSISVHDFMIRSSSGRLSYPQGESSSSATAREMIWKTESNDHGKNSTSEAKSSQSEIEMNDRIASYNVVRILLTHERVKPYLKRLLKENNIEGYTPFRLAVIMKSYLIADFIMDKIVEIESNENVMDVSNEGGDATRKLPLEYIFTSAKHELSTVDQDNPMFILCENETCSFTWTGPDHIKQDIYECRTCGLTDSLCCCTQCAKVCHKGHDCRLKRTSPTAYCDCWERFQCCSLIMGVQYARHQIFQRLLINSDLINLPNRYGMHLILFLAKNVERQLREQKQFRPTRRKHETKTNFNGPQIGEEPEHDLLPPRFVMNALALTLDNENAIVSFFNQEKKPEVYSETYRSDCQVKKSSTKHIDEFVFLLICKMPRNIIDILLRSFNRGSFVKCSENGSKKNPLLAMCLENGKSTLDQYSTAAVTFIRSVARIYAAFKLELSSEASMKRKLILNQVNPLEVCHHIFFSLPIISLMELPTFAVNLIEPIHTGLLIPMNFNKQSSQFSEAISNLESIFVQDRNTNVPLDSEWRQDGRKVSKTSQKTSATEPKGSKTGEKFDIIGKSKMSNIRHRNYRQPGANTRNSQSPNKRSNKTHLNKSRKKKRDDKQKHSRNDHNDDNDDRGQGPSKMAVDSKFQQQIKFEHSSRKRDQSSKSKNRSLHRNRHDAAKEGDANIYSEELLKKQQQEESDRQLAQELAIMYPQDIADPEALPAPSTSTSGLGHANRDDDGEETDEGQQHRLLDYYRNSSDVEVYKIENEEVKEDLKSSSEKTHQYNTDGRQSRMSNPIDPSIEHRLKRKLLKRQKTNPDMDYKHVSDSSDSSHDEEPTEDEDSKLNLDSSVLHASSSTEEDEEGHNEVVSDTESSLFSEQTNRSEHTIAGLHFTRDSEDECLLLNASDDSFVSNTGVGHSPKRQSCKGNKDAKKSSTSKKNNDNSSSGLKGHKSLSKSKFGKKYYSRFLTFESDTDNEEMKPRKSKKRKSNFSKPKLNEKKLKTSQDSEKRPGEAHPDNNDAKASSSNKVAEKAIENKSKGKKNKNKKDKSKKHKKIRQSPEFSEDDEEDYITDSNEPRRVRKNKYTSDDEGRLDEHPDLPDGHDEDDEEGVEDDEEDHDDDEDDPEMDNEEHYHEDEEDEVDEMHESILNPDDDEEDDDDDEDDDDEDDDEDDDDEDDEDGIIAEDDADGSILRFGRGHGGYDDYEIADDDEEDDDDDDEDENDDENTDGGTTENARVSIFSDINSAAGNGTEYNSRLSNWPILDFNSSTNNIQSTSATGANEATSLNGRNLSSEQQNAISNVQTIQTNLARASAGIIRLIFDIIEDIREHNHTPDLILPQKNTEFTSIVSLLLRRCITIPSYLSYSSVNPNRSSIDAASTSPVDSVYQQQRISFYNSSNYGYNEGETSSFINSYRSSHSANNIPPLTPVEKLVLTRDQEAYLTSFVFIKLSSVWHWLSSAMDSLEKQTLFTRKAVEYQLKKETDRKMTDHLSTEQFLDFLIQHTSKKEAKASSSYDTKATTNHEPSTAISNPSLSSMYANKKRHNSSKSENYLAHLMKSYADQGTTATDNKNASKTKSQASQSASNDVNLITYAIKILRDSNRRSSDLLNTSEVNELAFFDSDRMMTLLKLFSFHHVAYMADAFMYSAKIIQKIWPNGLPKLLNIPGLVVTSEPSTISTSSGLIKSEDEVIQESQIPTTRMNAYFRRGQSILSIKGPDLIDNPIETSLPLATSPNILSPASSREQLYGIITSDQSMSSEYSILETERLMLEHNFVDNVNPLHLYSIGRQLVDRTGFLDIMLNKWGYSLEMLSNVFRNDVGQDKNSFMQELSSFKLKERKFRHEMEKIRSLAKKDIILAIKRDRDNIILDTIKQLNSELYKRQCSQEVFTPNPSFYTCPSGSSNFQSGINNFNASSLGPGTGLLCSYRLKVSFNDEPAQGSGVNRAFFTAFAEAIISNEPLPELYSLMFSNTAGKSGSDSRLSQPSSDQVISQTPTYFSHRNSSNASRRSDSRSSLFNEFRIITGGTASSRLSASGLTSRNVTDIDSLLRGDTPQPMEVDRTSNTDDYQMKDRAEANALVKSEIESENLFATERAPLFWEPGLPGFFSPRLPESSFEGENVQIKSETNNSQKKQSNIVSNFTPKQKNNARLLVFRTVGRLIGLALLTNETIPIHFNRHILSYICGYTVNWYDFAFYNPTMFESLRKMIISHESTDPDQHCDVCDLGLSMSLNLNPEEGGPQKSNHSSKPLELVPNGEAICVTGENMYEYVKSFTYTKMVELVCEPLKQLREGVFDVLPKNSLDDLYPEDLRLLLNGSPVIEIDKLMIYTTFHNESGLSAPRSNANSAETNSSHLAAGASATTSSLHNANNASASGVGGASNEACDGEEDPRVSKLKSWFWAIVMNMDTVQRQNLLYFWTSSPSLPASEQGFQPNPTITIRPPDDTHWPTANTCISRLYLPLYSKKSILKEKLHQAIEVKSFGFV